MLEVDRDLTPRFQPEACSALVGAEAEQRVGRDDVAPAGATPRDALQLAQLLERVDADVRVGADADPDPALAQLLHRREAVAEVGLGREAEADSRAGIGDQIQLVSVRVSGVHDGRSGPEAATVGQQPDRPQALLSQALTNLARLLLRLHR